MKSRYIVRSAALLSTALAGAVGYETWRDRLPDGYYVKSADRGKAWLTKPDGFLVHGGLINKLYRGQRRVLVLAYPDSSRKPIDESCYVALLIDTGTHRVEQVSVTEAARYAEGMSTIVDLDRPCLQGMINS